MALRAPNLAVPTDAGTDQLHKRTRMKPAQFMEGAAVEVDVVLGDCLAVGVAADQIGVDVLNDLFKAAPGDHTATKFCFSKLM